MASRKDYEAVAAAFKEEIEAIGHGPVITPEDVHRHLAYAVAAFFTADNPRFDVARFMEASGVSYG